MTSIKPKLRTLASGDILFREGEVGDFAYQIISGEIEICKFNGDEYITLATLSKGALFGEMALIDRQPRSAMARATKETIVKEIDQKTLIAFFKNSPQTAFNMMQQLASYARNANEKLTVDAFDSPDENKNESANHAKDENLENKEKKQKEEMMKQLLDEYDNDIDRIKNREIPKPVKYTIFSFGFIVLFLILWSSFSEIDTSVSAAGKITTIVPNIEVQSNYKSVVKEVLVKKGQNVLSGETIIAEK